MRDGNANFFQKRPRHTVGLVQEREQKMLVSYFLLIELRSDILRRLQRLLHLLRKFIRSHSYKLSPARPRCGSQVHLLKRFDHSIEPDLERLVMPVDGRHFAVNLE